METTVEHLLFRKMAFIFNAVNSGWTVKKNGDAYIFSKEHDGKREVFSDIYLQKFIKENFDTEKLLK